MSSMTTFGHIINPFNAPQSSDLYLAQKITFKSFEVAYEFAKGHVDVELYSAQYPEDESFVPGFLTKTLNLNRSISDVIGIEGGKKLPILSDILDKLYETTEADYLIYSNVDIAVMPNFYILLKEILSKYNCEAFTINRRTIPETYKSPEELLLMYAEAGKEHLGHDCFVFKRDLYPKFDLGNVCIGVLFVGIVLLANMYKYSDRFRVFDKLHLSFHIGNSEVWQDESFKEYTLHNTEEFLRILEKLGKEYPLQNDWIKRAAEYAIQIKDREAMTHKQKVNHIYKMRRRAKYVLRKLADKL